MITNPFFTIIIPTYNRANLLGLAIESVLAQTFAEWEMIIVDDGSTDNTRQIIESFTDNRIKYLYQKNSERSAARNNGIEKSSGSYICFLDSDDYFLPERLKSIYKELEIRDFPIAAFYTGLTSDKNGVLVKREESVCEVNLFNHLALSVIHSQQTCIQHTILKEFKFDTQFHIGEDMELWLRIAARFPFVYLKNLENVVVVDHEDRSVNVKKFNSYPDQMRMLRRIFSNDHPGKNISPKVKKRLISNCYFGTAKYFIYNGDRLKALKNIFDAIRSDRGHFQNKYRLNIAIRLLLPGGIEKARQLLE